jgi:hypothetical protein
MELSLGFAMTGDKGTVTSTDQSHIRDRDVFKGLQIALAAACDKDVDLWITKMSGCRVRKYLADLRAFGGLGVNNLADEAIRDTKKRRKEYIRRARDHEQVHVRDRERVAVEEKPKTGDKSLEGMPPDVTGRRGLLIAQMLGRREARASESINERALRMGWRHRSVSAGS